MVGDDVEDLAQADFAQRLAEALVSLGPAELFVDFAMVDDVVAVAAVRGGLQVGGAVDVGYA